MEEDVKALIKDCFICGIDVVRLSDSIKGLAYDNITSNIGTGQSGTLI